MPGESEWEQCVAYVEQVIERKLTRPERALLAQGFTYGQRAGRRKEARVTPSEQGQGE